ncbi:MAG TPA: hypothetical protein VF747_02340 [Blastocatellia bacterium]|jgi:hypothetical protein
MKRVAMLTTVILLLPVFVAEASAQKQPSSPTDTVINFYQALKQRRYVEGFRHSIYRKAVEGLTPGQLQDLEPDFAQTFSAIPDKIEPRGEQITGDSAVVFLKFDGMGAPQQVALIRVNGEWLVGDQDGFAEVNAQGGSFFFNTRIQVNENEAFEMLSRIIDAELIYSKRFEGKNASMQELIRLNGVPADLEGGESGGYRFTLTLSGDAKSFAAAASPIAYGKTGRLSFYADINGVRAEDLKGQMASEKSPAYRAKQ